MAKTHGVDEGIDSTVRTHTECLFDICNYCGRNAGAWADLWGTDVITFGGCWHGDDGTASTNWMPGYCKPLNPKPYWTYGTWFAVKGDVSALISRFKNDEVPEPEDFKGLEIFASDDPILDLGKEMS